MSSPELFERDLAQQFDQTAQEPSQQDLATLARYAATVPSIRHTSRWKLRVLAVATATALLGITVIVQRWPSSSRPPSPAMSSSAAPLAAVGSAHLDSAELREDDNAEAWLDDGDPSGLGLLHASNDSSDLDALVASYEELF